MRLDDTGAIEVLPLALLTFLAGVLVLVHAWAVVDARDLASTAARAGARAVAESGPGAPEPVATAAARAAIDDRRRRQGDWDISVDGRLDRCRPVTVRVHTTVPLLRLPWLRAPVAVQVTAAHTEIVDPFRAGLSGIAACGA